MANFEHYFNHHLVGFWIGFFIALIVLAIWVLVTHLRYQQLRRRFESSLSQVEDGNVPAMLTDYLNRVQQVTRQTGQTEDRVAKLYENFPFLVRHVGLVRFSPFHDTGGDQSFSMAILDGRGDGVVLSALHSRHESKLYAKPVSGRSSSYPLTEEEKRAIDETLTPEQASR